MLLAKNIRPNELVNGFYRITYNDGSSGLYIICKNYEDRIVSISKNGYTSTLDYAKIAYVELIGE
ncbi:MAG: hypothetical protein R3230_01130 [Nitrosopumilaceae archaeon]|nr:hypothetical protein [Nitrosopumilaceae archaeon]